MLFRSLLLLILSCIIIPTYIHLLLDGLLFDVLIMTLVFSSISLLLAGIRYIISDKKLYIRIWFIPLASIQIAEITSIKRSYNPLSSPAASLKRIAVYKMNVLQILISPDREDEFIDMLKTINPHIFIDIPHKSKSKFLLDWDI